MRIVKALLMVVTAAGAVVAPSAAQAQSRVTVPDTPAGVILNAWLEAFNSGDSLRLDAYYRQYEPDRLAPPAMATQRLTGGFDLVSVERAGPAQIEVTLKERKNTDRFAYGIIAPRQDGSTRVATFRLLSLGEKSDVPRIDAAARSQVIEGALAKLDEWYVFPDVAKQAGDSLRQRLGRGAYDSYRSGVGFAARLHDELREITRDKHMTVAYAFAAPSPAPQPAPPQSAPQSAPGVGTQQQPQPTPNSCGFVKTEVLEGNIGYIKFNGFASPAVCAQTASAAMDSVAGAKALVVDLRDNGGGSPEMVAHISSYLFARKTHLNNLWDRKTGNTIEFWTSEDVPGRRFGGEKPVYVLTSSRTFSAAEEFSYNLKNLKRAVIVGETTGGGAHPVMGHKLDDHFTIVVPSKRAISPITKTNWEGVGVLPDVKVPASEALTTALQLIAGKPRV